MSEKTNETKLCKHCQTEIPKKAKVCPNCKKKQNGGCLAWGLAVVGAIIAIVAFASMMGGGSTTAKKVGTAETKETQEEVSNVFTVGDIVETSKLRITYISGGEYESDYEFLQPKDGYVYWKFEFNFENISNSDQTVSSLVNWECYADNVKVDQTWIGDENGLDATISSGRTTQGAIYFEIPEDAQTIELEYDINFWGNAKIIFIGK